MDLGRLIPIPLLRIQFALLLAQRKSLRRPPTLYSTATAAASANPSRRPNSLRLPPLMSLGVASHSRRFFVRKYDASSSSLRWTQKERDIFPVRELTTESMPRTICEPPQWNVTIDVRRRHTCSYIQTYADVCKHKYNYTMHTCVHTYTRTNVHVHIWTHVSY